MPLTLRLIERAGPDDLEHAGAASPTAVLRILSGDRIVISASHSAPPGAPLTLLLSDGETIEAKTRNCRRAPGQGAYLLEARLLNLSRARRARLEQLTNPAPGQG